MLPAAADLMLLMRTMTTMFVVAHRNEIPGATNMRRDTERQFRELLLSSTTASSSDPSLPAPSARSGNRNSTVSSNSTDQGCHRADHDEAECANARPWPAISNRRDPASHRARRQDHASSIAFEFRVLTDPETHGFPLPRRRSPSSPTPPTSTVLVHENSILPFFGGHVGVIGQCALDDLTGELVEKHLLAVARKVLRGTGAT